MEFGRNGHRGVCVHLPVVEAKEQGQGHALLLSMGEGRVKDLKRITSLVILLSVQVSPFCFCLTFHLGNLYMVSGVQKYY